MVCFSVDAGQPLTTGTPLSGAVQVVLTGTAVVSIPSCFSSALRAGMQAAMLLIVTV